MRRRKENEMRRVETELQEAKSALKVEILQVKKVPNMKLYEFSVQTMH